MNQKSNYIQMIHIYFVLITVPQGPVSLNFALQGQNIIGKLGHYNGYRCPGSVHYQFFSSHYIINM